MTESCYYSKKLKVKSEKFQVVDSAGLMNGYDPETDPPAVYFLFFENTSIEIHTIVNHSVNAEERVKTLPCADGKRSVPLRI